MSLRPHQIEPVNRLLEIFRSKPSAVDLSDTGTGKTYVAAAVANKLKLPTLVICPKIAITSWHRAARHFGDCFSVTNYERLRTGRTPYGKWLNMPPPQMPETWLCQSCQRPVDLNNSEPCYTHHLGIHCIQKKKTEWKYGRFNFDPRIKFLIFDEVHRSSGIDSLNAEILIAARRQGIPTLGLSATAACSPLQMRALGYLLDLHTLTPSRGLGFYEWAGKYGCRRDPNIGPGVHWLVSETKQRQVMAEIHSKIIPARGVRVRTEQIPGFPERDISAELYDTDDPQQVDTLYSDMADALSVLEEKKSQDVAPDSALTKILRARQKLELLKTPIACELARDYLAKGYSVGIFCDFHQTLDELAKRLECDCIIDGRRIKTRQDNIDYFQSNAKRLILVQNQAGGICVSLQDLDGEHPRIGIVFPTFSLVTMQQLFGRFHRDGGKSKCFYRVLFMAHTVEEDVYTAWRAKGNNLDALNDSDLIPEKFRLHRAGLSTLLK